MTTVRDEQIGREDDTLAVGDGSGCQQDGSEIDVTPLALWRLEAGDPLLGQPCAAEGWGSDRPTSVACKNT